MLGLTRRQTTDGFVDFCVRVPKEKAAQAQAALDALVASLKRVVDEDERSYTIEEVFPGMGPGDSLAGARYRENMTQAALAKAIGVQRSHISEMEHGRRPIGKEMAKRLAKALGTHYKVFL